MFDMIIRGGTVIDGAGRAPETADIAIAGDTIAALGDCSREEAARSVDAAGKYVCPGFIDIHSHSDFHMLVRPAPQSKIQQGVTTEVCGNCGLSAAPLEGPVRRRREKELYRLGIEPRWHSMSEYIDLLRSVDLLTNMAPLIGHGNVRGGVMGYENMAAGKTDIQAMTGLLGREMAAGAWGLTSGLIYPPGMYSSSRELIALASAVTEFGGIYSAHIRSEGPELEAAIEEVLNVGERSGGSLQISHLKSLGKRNWHKLPRVFAMIESARSRGCPVTADRYPYTASSTGLDALLPQWLCQGSVSDICKRLADPAVREKARQEILKEAGEEELGREIVIACVGSAANAGCEGETLNSVARQRKQTVCDTLFSLLAEERLDVDALFFSMSEDNAIRILQKDYVMIGSDASVRDCEGVLSAGKPHPRGFGTFPRVLQKYVFQEQVLSLESAIYKMTGFPAEKMGFRRRGLLREGCYADIVVFDRHALADNATYACPQAYPSGISMVLVNGCPVVEDGVHTGAFPGRPLLRGKT